MLTESIQYLPKKDDDDNDDDDDDENNNNNNNLYHICNASKKNFLKKFES
jgi:hypothetical protein